MLGKLIKHDTRSIAKVAVPMFIASGIVSVVCCAMLYFTFGYSEQINSLIGAVFVTGSFYALGILAILAMWAITAVISIVRYYKSLFTDEGYLNMVLPVKTNTLFLAKLLSTFIWMTLSSLVAGACIFIAVYIPTSLYDNALITALLDELRYALGSGGGQSILVKVTYILEAVGLIVSSVSSMLTVITAVTIGATVAKRYKVFGCIIFYFAISFVVETLVSVASIVFGAVLGDNAEISVLLVAIFTILLSVASGVAMYFINIYILNKKFNIE